MAVFSSTMTRSVQTAVGVGKGAAQYVKWKALDEIDVGICDGKLFSFFFSYSISIIYSKQSYSPSINP